MRAHGLLGEDVPEELAAGGEDHLVRAEVVRVGLVVVCGEGAVEKLAVVADPGEGPRDVCLEVVPPQAGGGVEAYQCKNISFGLIERSLFFTTLCINFLDVYKSSI